MVACTIKDCNRKRAKNGYCYAHNKRFEENGNPISGKKLKYHAKTLVDAFDSRYKKSNISECWEWKGWKNKGGYGYFSFDGFKYAAHRHAYTLRNGSIPHGLMICHKCDNPSCVNPDHLFAGTNGDNVRDAYLKKRRNPVPIDSMPRGDNCYLSKLTEKDVIDIKKMFNDGKRNTEIAKIYGVIHQTISCIRNNKTWKHVHVGEK
jgi:hypothetical protein